MDIPFVYTQQVTEGDIIFCRQIIWFKFCNDACIHDPISLRIHSLVETIFLHFRSEKKGIFSSALYGSVYWLEHDLRQYLDTVVRWHSFETLLQHQRLEILKPHVDHILHSIVSLLYPQLVTKTVVLIEPKRGE